jgi:[ribosomal protein S5]-alanine N-acetyltransferase
MPFPIETERLQIRPWAAPDRTTFERFVSDTEMMRYISHGRVWDEARIDGYFQRQAGFLATHGCCVGAVCLKRSGTVIGMGGIQPLEKAGLFELAWWIWKDHWGQGLATEMAGGCRDYAFRVMRLPRVVAVIDAPNIASIRVAEKLGMRCLGAHDPHELAERYAPGEILLYDLQSKVA